MDTNTEINPDLYDQGCAFAVSHEIYLKNNQHTLTLLFLCGYTNTRDFQALTHFGKFNYLMLSSKKNYNDACRHLVPPWASYDLFFEYYAQSNSDIFYLKNVYSFCYGFLETIIKKNNVNAIVFSGLARHSDSGFLRTLYFISSHILKIPSICLFNGNLTIPKPRVNYVNLLKDFNFKFYGDQILTFSQKTTGSLKSSNITDKNTIHTVGAPRLDFWRNFKPNTNEQNNIVLFSYPPSTYYAPISFIYMLHVMSRKSIQFKNSPTRFIVKCKHISDYNETIAYLQGISHCLEVSFELDVINLLQTARAVYGYNSLACAESLLSNANLYIPYFADTKLSTNELQMSFLKNNTIDGFKFLLNQQELDESIDYEVNREINIINQKKRKTFFKKFFFSHSTKNSTELFENHVSKLINEKT